MELIEEIVKYIPVINYGYHAGDNPSCWDGVEFDTEKECQQWISDMQYLGNFTFAEMGGNITPYPVTSKRLNK